MAYTGEISRDHPTCFLFVIDQSGSMDEKMGSGRSKADFVADVLNKTLATLVANCTKADGVRSYFDIGVVAYGGNGVTSGLSGDLIQPISKIGERPLRVEERTKKSDHGACGIIDERFKLPLHVGRFASGKGYTVGDGARGFIFNGDPKCIVDFFEIGTRPRLISER